MLNVLEILKKSVSELKTLTDSFLNIADQLRPSDLEKALKLLDGFNFENSMFRNKENPTYSVVKVLSFLKLLRGSGKQEGQRFTWSR